MKLRLPRPPLPPSILLLILVSLIVLSMVTALASILAGCSDPSFAIPPDQLAADVAGDELELDDVGSEGVLELPDAALEASPDVAGDVHDAALEATPDTGHTCKQCAGTCPAGDDDKFCFGSCLSSGFSRCTWTPSGSPRCACAL